MPPQISMGNGGHRGVTHLVAVGDTDDDASTSTDKTVSAVGIGVAVLGAVANSPKLFWGGAGVAGGILFARWWRSRQKVAVTSPTGRW